MRPWSGRSDGEVLEKDEKDFGLETFKKELKGTYLFLFAQQTDEVSWKVIVDKVEFIYERYPEWEDIAYDMHILVNI